MPFKGPEKKKYNVEYYAQQKEEREYKKLSAELQSMLRKADPSGPRYKSEILSNAQLTALYEKYVYGKKFLGTDGFSFEQFLEYRDKARKDLFWLGTGVFHKNWVSRVHQPVCDFFVQKNFDGCFPEGYTLEQVHRAIGRQDTVKRRLLLDPRGHYKTTIDGVDCVQWIINCPDIRIFIVSGEKQNSKDFLTEIKEYFYQPKGAELTDFQLLFPEFVLRGVDGTSEQPFVCPARKHAQKNMTLWVNSITSTLASQHCDILKADDAVSDKNSNEEMTRKKLKRKFNNVTNILDPWGFLDMIGTRYFPDDLYGDRLEAVKNGTAKLKTSIRSSLIVKTEFEGTPWKQLELHMVDLLFPERTASVQESWDFLKDMIDNDLTQFLCQQMNIAAGNLNSEYVNPFTDALLTRSTTHASCGPPKNRDEIYIWWDTALTDGKQSDFCAGVVGQIWQKPDKKWELFIWEILADKMTTFDMARNMVAQSKRWSPYITQFEQPRSLEVKDFLSTLNHQKMLQEYYGDIRPVPPDPHKDAKPIRIKGLETLFRMKLIRFANGPWIDLAFEQFKKFTGLSKNKGRKDDIPDAIASLARRMPYIGIEPNPEGELEKKKREEDDELRARRQVYDRIFNGVPGSYVLNHGGVSVEEEVVSPIHKALAPLNRQVPQLSFSSGPKSNQ